jgi:hypothetical protein
VHREADSSTPHPGEAPVSDREFQHVEYQSTKCERKVLSFVSKSRSRCPQWKLQLWKDQGEGKQIERVVSIPG